MNKYVFYGLIFICLYNCSQNSNTESTTTNPPESNLTGQELAKAYCASCHLYPDPTLLDKSTWQTSVLPKMAQHLGLEQDAFKLFSGMDMEEMQAVINAGIYPDNPTINKADFDKIVTFYVENAPEKPIPQDSKTKVTIGLPNFKLIKSIGKYDEIPAVTFVKFDTAHNTILVGNRGSKNILKKHDLNFKLIDSINIKSPISDILINSKDLGILTMGLMDPNDKKRGEFALINEFGKSKLLIADSLRRPVNITKADLNNDKIDDFIICNFGNQVGSLIWIDGKTKKQNTINNLPGSRKAIIKDMNGDNKPDIMVLMTQAKEQIILYLNNGLGFFSEKILLRFPPVYGSSYFELDDFNNDGYMDILYTNGDNADLSIVLKKYHGIRIFMNGGKNNFKQTYFYPMYGASKAMAADFDLDGDLDIAAISFFPDQNQKPNEGFLLLSNTGNNKDFKINSIKEANEGKWMVMDINDMDHDGDTDIILGSFKLKMAYFGTTYKNSINSIILKNKIR